jgi:23S rRNA (guanine745-N1)-methyltransferase
VPTLLCTVRDCRAPLAREERRAVCARGHSFDLSRSGYINLLQPQDRRSREPGDSAALVAARRRIFERGITKSIDDAIVKLVHGETILDAGCGEGHYLDMFGGSGIDISVPAIEAAARRYPENEWIVANADRFIPYDDASFGTVLSITARLNPSEFRRVVRTDGMLLVAIAGPDDLVELRGHSRDRVARTVEMFAAHFALDRQERIAFSVDVDAATLRDLVLTTYRPKRMKDVERITMSRDLLLFRPS